MRASTDPMDLVTLNFWVRVILAVADASVLAMLIYAAVFHPASVSRREILWQAFGVLSLTAGLVFATLHRPNSSSAYGARRSERGRRNT
jgi:hypothetical protein